MTETAHNHSHKKEYFIIFVLLGILTLAEIAIPEMKLAYSVHASSLSALALVKAFLVAYFYMHLKDETRWLKFIAALPAFAFMYATYIVVESVIR